MKQEPAKFKMSILDLFSGIGGFSIGLERAGMKTVAFCEIEPFCRAVLRKHWPEVPIYEDVRTLTADVLERDGITGIDAICGGFPCQDISFAGKRAGLEGERSGLWSEIRRLAGELRPRFVILENVPGLLSLGMDAVLGDLSTLGYDAVWDCVPAAAVGAPHRRDRVWIVAHAAGGRLQGERNGKFYSPPDDDRQTDWPGSNGQDVAHAQSERRGEAGRDRRDEPTQRTAGGGEDVAHTDNTGLEGRQRGGLSERTGERTAWEGRASVPDAARAECAGRWAITSGQQGRPSDDCWREPQSRLGGVADGLQGWMDEPAGVPRVATGIENRASRLKALGNSIVPQVAEIIGRAIVQAQGASA